jgi:hypothetical protein
MTKTLLPAILFLLKPKNNFVFKLFHVNPSHSQVIGPANHAYQYC